MKIFVFTGISKLDSLLGGLNAGEIIYIDGDSNLIDEIPNNLCVHTYRTFNSSTLYIDGGVCADPYKIAKYARVMEINEDETLNHVQITRSFTVYQLVTYILHLLEKDIQKFEPRTLIVGKFPMLFSDPEVPPKESMVLLEHSLVTLSELTKKYNLITVLTNRKDRQYPWGIRKVFQSFANETVRIMQRENYISIDLLKREESTVVHHIGKHQLYLDQFGMVMVWDEPFHRFV